MFFSAPSDLQENLSEESLTALKLGADNTDNLSLAHCDFVQLLMNIEEICSSIR